MRAHVCIDSSEHVHAVDCSWLRAHLLILIMGAPVLSVRMSYCQLEIEARDVRVSIAAS